MQKLKSEHLKVMKMLHADPSFSFVVGGSTDSFTFVYKRRTIFGSIEYSRGYAKCILKLFEGHRFYNPIPTKNITVQKIKETLDEL